MHRFVADENFDLRVVTGIAQANPELDIVRAQEVGLGNTDDRIILAWAGETGRILLTHDARTMSKYAGERIAEGLPMPGIVIVRWATPVGRAVEDILILAGCLSTDEWENQIWYVPL